MKGLSATESRIRFGELIDDLTDESEPVLVEAKQEPFAIGLLQVDLDELHTGSIPANWMEIADRASERVAKWLNGRPLPDIDELINFGRDDID